MNIFLKELKTYRRSIIIWSIGMFIMAVAGMAKYSGFASGGQSINDLISGMPEAVLKIMGMNYFDLSKASGFYGVLFPYLLIMAVIHAAMLGANIISKEERDKTAEFLLVKPVSRNSVITSKLLAALVNIFILNIVALLSSIWIVDYYSKGETVYRDIIVLMLGMLVLQLVFMLLGTAIASISRKPQAAPSLSTGILLAAYVISKAIDLNSKLENLKYITPFKYFEPQKLMYGGSFEPVFLILSFLLIAVFLYITYAFYKKRDLNL